MKIKKGDKVKVIAGRDIGKEGKVVRILRGEGRVVVEGVNLLKKHARQKSDKEQAGIVTITSPINVSNVMVVCSKCKKPSRIGWRVRKDGSKVRFCRRCEGELN